MKKTVYLLFLLLITKVFSQNISLDTTFGINGYVDGLYNGEFSNTAFILPDGKVLLAGTANASNQFLIEKYNIDGSRDVSFGTNGSGYITNNSITNQKEYAYKIKGQQDGKILIAGKSDVNPSLSGYYYNALLARFQDDGTIDTSFGTNGYVKTEFGSNDDYIIDIQITTSGNIYAIGNSRETATDYRMAKIVKYDASGNLDTTFASSGIQTIAMAHGVVLTSIFVQNDGTILLTGSSTDITDNSDLLLVKLDANGSLDASFGTNGMLLLDLGYTNEYITDFVIHNNKILATGTVSGSSFLPHLFVARFTMNGALDTTFSTDGYHIETPDATGYNTSFGRKIRILPDGTILASANAIGNNNYDLFLLAFNDDGTRKTNFGNNGQYLFQNTERQDFSSDVLIQNDGKIIVTGVYTTTTNTTKRNMLVRFKDAYTLSNPVYELQDKIELYPNPTKANIHIRTNVAIEKITIHTLSGQIVKEITNPTNTIPTDFLSSGVYIIKVMTSKGNLVSKFIKS